jgi:iron complex transport system permease protein
MNMSGGIFQRRRFLPALCVLLVLLICAAALGMAVGTLPFTLGELWETLTGGGTRRQRIALFSIRFPRLTAGLLTGGALAASGTVLQSVTGNDLAEPGVLGIGSGAALFVTLYIYLTNGNNYYGLPVFTALTLPVFAFLGGGAAALLVYALSRRHGRAMPDRLLLMGIAVNAAFGAIIIFIQIRFGTKDFNRVLMWTSGSIWGSGWMAVLTCAPLLCLLCGAALFQSRYLDLYTLGDETAAGLGVDVEKRRRGLITLAAALAAVAASLAGNVAFAGLMAPHIARKLAGPRHRYLMPAAILTGMLLVITADMAAKNLFAPVELHLGAVISMIGAPYFIYLILKKQE